MKNQVKKTKSVFTSVWKAIDETLIEDYRVIYRYHKKDIEKVKNIINRIKR